MQVYRVLAATFAVLLMSGPALAQGVSVSFSWGWTQAAGSGPAEGFVLERKCGTATAFSDVTPLAGPSARTYSTTQADNLLCQYQVRAYNQAGRSGPSNVVSKSTWVAPNAPTNLVEQPASAALEDATNSLVMLQSQAGGDRVANRWLNSARSKTDDALSLTIQAEERLSK